VDFESSGYQGVLQEHNPSGLDWKRIKEDLRRSDSSDE